MLLHPLLLVTYPFLSFQVFQIPCTSDVPTEFPLTGCYALRSPRSHDFSSVLPAAEIPLWRANFFSAAAFFFAARFGWITCLSLGDRPLRGRDRSSWLERGQDISLIHEILRFFFSFFLSSLFLCPPIRQYASFPVGNIYSCFFSPSLNLTLRPLSRATWQPVPPPCPPGPHRSTFLQRVYLIYSECLCPLLCLSPVPSKLFVYPVPCDDRPHRFFGGFVGGGLFEFFWGLGRGSSIDQ